MPDATALESVELAVLANRFEGVVRAMMNTLMRTSRSGVINTARDFSCCVLTADHELLCFAESLPIHVMSGPDIMARHMVAFHPELRRGDAFLHNCPYHGNSHAADHAILVPVVDDGGVHRFTVMAKAHLADCGNAKPTTYMAEARDVYAEGALIFPCVKTQENHRDIADVIRMCRARIRAPEQWWGDYLALMGAARIGETRLLELGAETGWDRLRAFEGQWFDYSEARMRALVARLPVGSATVGACHDPIPAAPDGVPIKVSVTIRPEKGEIGIDLTDNMDCQPFGLNLSEATARSAAMVGVFNSLHEDIPGNAGSFRALDIRLRENCVVGIPRHPTSCSVATTNLFDRTANAVQRAFAEIADGFGMAEVGCGLPPSQAVISGPDPESEDGIFINELKLAWTNGAASPYADGWLNAGGVGDGGALLRDSIELDEMRFPIRILAQRLLPDSEGPGRFRGAPAAYLEYAPTGSAIEVMYISDGTIAPAEGVRGGGAGARAEQYRRLADGTTVALDICGRETVPPGESIISICCGGGGYGRPVDRDPEMVAGDVGRGLVSAARARLIYGVVLDGSGAVLRRETERLRATMGGLSDETVHL